MQPVQPAVPIQPVPSVPADPNPAPTLQSLEHQPELPTVRSGWMDWFAAHAPRRQGPLSAEDAQRISELAGNADPNPAFVGPYLAARNRVSELERATAQSATGSDRGKGVSRYLDEKDWELQSVRARVRELEDMIQMRESRASFESAASRELQEERPPGLPTVLPHVKHPSDPIGTPDPWQAWHDEEVHERVRTRLFTTPEPMHVHVMPDQAPANTAPPSPPPGDDDDGTTSSSSSSDERKKRKKKKKKKEPYKVKNAEMRLPPYPNTLTFQSWRRSVRTATISACEKPERARAFVFSVEAEGASFESLATSDTDRHRALDAKLADGLLKVVKGDLSRRLAVMSESLAKRGLVLSGRQILLLIYKEFSKDAHQTDCTSYTHLEKIQCGKDVRGLETFLAVWDNLMLNFQTPPTRDHMYSAFLSKIRVIPELQDALLIQKRLPWGDAKKTYEALREACDLLIEETRQENQRRQIDRLYETGGAATALAATPEEKSKMPCFFVRDGKTCPNGSTCPYSHQRDIIEKARKDRADYLARKGDPKGKGKGKGKSDPKGKGKSKGKGKGKADSPAMIVVNEFANDQAGPSQQAPPKAKPAADNVKK